MGGPSPRRAAWLQGEQALTEDCLGQWVGQPTSRQRVNNLISCSRNFKTSFQKHPSWLNFFFFLSLLCRPTSFLKAFLSNSEFFSSASVGPAGMALSRGAYCFVSFSCLDCSSAPRSGSQSCQPGITQIGLGRYYFRPVLSSCLPHPLWSGYSSGNTSWENTRWM